MSEKPSRMLEVLVEMGVFELFFPKMNSNNASLLGDIDLAANHQLNLSQRCAVLLSSLNVEDILNYTLFVPHLNEQNQIVEYRMFWRFPNFLNGTRPRPAPPRPADKAG